LLACSADGASAITRGSAGCVGMMWLTSPQAFAGLAGHRHAAALPGQAGEGLRAGVLVHQVQVAEQQHVLLVELRHCVRIDQLAVEGA